MRNKNKQYQRRCNNCKNRVNLKKFRRDNSIVLKCPKCLCELVIELIRCDGCGLTYNKKVKICPKCKKPKKIFFNT